MNENEMQVKIDEIEKEASIAACLHDDITAKTLYAVSYSIRNHIKKNQNKHKDKTNDN